MTKEQQYWEDAHEALSRIFDRCKEIDLQSGYDMLEDIQFVRGFINKHKPQAENEDVLDKIRAEIKEWYWQADKQALAKDPCVVDAMVDLFIRTIDKYKAESEK